jgi:hypothetical protein
MAEVFLPIIFSIIIGITYYLSNRFSIRKKDHEKKLMSFSAGVSITYVLLELFPSFTEVALGINKLLFISIPFGFLVHHLIEKYIYKHNNRHDLVKMLSLEERTFSFIYHIILGIVLVTIFSASTIQGTLLAFTILTFTFVSTLPTYRHKSHFKSMILSSATTFGVIIAAFIWKNIPIWIQTTLVGIVTGVLLFTVIRHHIPFGKKGKIGYFTIGFLLFTTLIVISWYF